MDEDGTRVEGAEGSLMAGGGPPKSRRLVRRPALGHRGRLQDLRRVVRRPRASGARAGRGARARRRGARPLTAPAVNASAEVRDERVPAPRCPRATALSPRRDLTAPLRAWDSSPRRKCKMENWSAMILVIALAAPAFADATADARAHDEAFAKACEAGD